MGAKPIRGLDDSKVLTALQREKFAVKIRERAVAVAVGAASVREIDRLNIRRASILAMERALRRLGVVPAHVLIDGLPCPELGCEHEAIVDRSEERRVGKGWRCRGRPDHSTKNPSDTSVPVPHRVTSTACFLR